MHNLVASIKEQFKWTSALLLTLLAVNNMTIEFRPALTNLGAFAAWAPLSIVQFQLRPIRQLPQTLISPMNPHPFGRHGRASSRSGRCGAHTSHCRIECGNYCQLALDWLFLWIISRRLYQCLIVSMLLRNKETQGGWAYCRVLVLWYESLSYSIAYWDHSSSSCWQEGTYAQYSDWHRFRWQHCFVLNSVHASEP